MKLTYVATCYPSYLESFSARYPQFSSDDYTKKKEALEFDAYGWSGFWKHYLRPLGYEVEEIIANIRPLQFAWASENNIEPGEDDWVLGITRAQILKSKPEVLFVNNYSLFGAQWLKEIRSACPSIRMIVGWCGAPFSDETVFSEYDLVLSCVPELVEQFRKMGLSAEVLSQGFDPRILDRIGPRDEYKTEFSFVGQIVMSQEFHKTRADLLEYLIDSTPLTIFSPHQPMSAEVRFKTHVKSAAWHISKALKKLGAGQGTLKKVPVISKASLWKERPSLPYSAKLAQNTQTPVFGLKMFETLRDSKVTFNNHIGLSAHSASNMRLFEATGVGTCLLTDWKENLKEFFEPDSEVVTYRSAAECAEKVNWLLSHPQECADIGVKGQSRTLRDHSFNFRAEKVNQFIRNTLERNCS